MNNGTGGTNVLDFLISFFVVGFLLSIVATILSVFRPLADQTSSLYDLSMYIWYAFPITFSILAIIWLYGRMKEWKLRRRL